MHSPSANPDPRLEPRADGDGFDDIEQGMLRLVRGDLVDGLELLRRHPDDAFCAALVRFVERHGHFKPLGRAFDSSVPYAVWTRTAFYRDYLTGTVDALRSFARRHPAPDACAGPTIIDIGTGNGVLLAEVVTALVPFGPVTLWLVEPSADMLAAASRHCADGLGHRAQIHAVHGRIQDLADSLAPASKPWFIHAAASLHHVPYEAKVSTMAALARLGCPLLVSDFDFDHDLVEPYSRALFRAVHDNYGPVIEDILQSPTSVDDQARCIDEFILSEVITIVSSTRAAWGDYHALVHQWEAAAVEAGYVVHVTITTAQVAGRRFAFTMELVPSA